MSQERLQKILARAGIASRRAAEALISAGRVKVDGRTIRELGTQADPEQQRIEVDGRRVGSEPLLYLVLHKPREVVSTLNDPVKRHTVMELVAGAGARVVPVGRLDYHTSGVLLFSNDGQFSRTLLHPSSGVPRQYVLKVKGPIEEGRLERLRDRIVIDGRRTQPADVVRERNEGDKVWLLITLREGRNRHVRRLAEHAGFQVMRLARLSFANISAEGLAPGQWRALTRDELSELKRLYGVPKELPAGGGAQERVEGSPVRMRTRVAQAERALRPPIESEDEDAAEPARGGGRVLPNEPTDKRRGADRPPLKRRAGGADSNEQRWSKPARGAVEPRAPRRRTGADAHSSEQPWSKPARGAAKPFHGAAAPYAKKRGVGEGSSEQAWGKPARGVGKPVRGAGKPVRGAGKPVRGAGKPARGAAAPFAKARRTDASEQAWAKPARGVGKPVRGAAAPYAKPRRAAASEQPWGKPARGAAKPYRGTAAPYAKKRGSAPDTRSNERASGTSGLRGKKRGAARGPSLGSASARPRGKQSRPSSRRGPL
ncbi:MAG: pseudouridine synthase [Polyangiaceae bacterium]